jgi:cobalt-zinc-cadmium efflux system outer membrane protein
MRKDLKKIPGGKNTAAHNRTASVFYYDNKYMILGIAIVALSACATTQEKTARREYNARAQIIATEKYENEETKEKPDAVDGSLESYIAYAMRRSPELEASFARWHASVNRIAENRRLPDPVLSYAYYIQSVETKVGPQRHRVGLKQTFPWPSRLTAGADAASARAKALEGKFDARAIAIRARVAEAYWRLWLWDEILAVQVEHLEVLRALSESAEALVMTGATNLADQQQVDLSVARLEDRLAEIEEQKIRAAAELRRVIGAPGSLKVSITSTPPPEIAPDANEQQLLEDAFNHPFIRSFDALEESSEAEARRETANRFPSFTLGLDWIETGQTSTPNVQDNGKDAVIVGVGVALPLWQSNYKDSVEAHHSDARAYHADARAARDRTVANLQNTLSDLRDAYRRIDLYRGTLVPQAETVFESVLGAYTAGRSNLASILLAQRDLLELRVQLQSARAEYARSWARLENTVGRAVLPTVAGLGEKGNTHER